VKLEKMEMVVKHIRAWSRGKHLLIKKNM